MLIAAVDTAFSAWMHKLNMKHVKVSCETTQMQPFAVTGMCPSELKLCQWFWLKKMPLFLMSPEVLSIFLSTTAVILRKTQS